MNNMLSVLISSCNNFSDLWDENIKLYQKNWKNNSHPTYLVTDTETSWRKKDINVLVAKDQDSFPLRIRYALQYIDTPYVLITLDDYFLIEPVANEKIDYLLQRMQNEKIQYLSLYDRRKIHKKHHYAIENLYPIDLNQKYAVTLYPAIWEVEFLKKTIKKDMNPWLYEVSLTSSAREEKANCQANLAGVFNILDVVRKGKVLHKARRYLKKHGSNLGGRPSISYGMEFKLFLLDIISWHTPRKLFVWIKSIAQKLGMKFFSED